MTAEIGITFLDRVQYLSSVPLVRSTCKVSTSQATLYQRWERVLPLPLSCPRKRVTLEIKRDLLQAECGRPKLHPLPSARSTRAVHFEMGPIRSYGKARRTGRQRPLGIAALEDKIVQHAVGTVLNQIYEEDFLGFSYGFRPGRSQHDALDALWMGIMRKKVNWVLDADVRDFFGSISHEWMVKFLQHRIADRRILRLIKKWLRAGVSEDGEWSKTEVGTPQGSVISPMLGNVYLHYVFDLWVQHWRKHRATGEVIVVRYADDSVLGF